MLVVFVCNFLFLCVSFPLMASCKCIKCNLLYEVKVYGMSVSVKFELAF